MRDILELLGRKIDKIEFLEEEGDKREMILTLSNGEKYKFFHSQDCCEDVRIYDIVGDIDDLIGAEILMAGVISSQDFSPEDQEIDYKPIESYTWTFYKFATINGYVDIRWIGESNGYYSEEVHFNRIK